MRRMTAVISLTAPLLLGAFAVAGNDIPVPPFTGLNVHSGADVNVSYGPVQRVTVIAGDLKKGRIQVKDGHTLEVSACEGFCLGNHTLKVDVVMPKIESVVAHSGADVKASGNFPKQAHLSVQASSGGDVDLAAIPADTVDAAAHSGGSARVKALSALNAKASSGGDVTYLGHPAHINSQANSGGDISGTE